MAEGHLPGDLPADAPRVVCIQRRLTHYRVPLFEEMRSRLAAAGVRFELVFGDATPEEAVKRDEGRLEWATYVPCRYSLGGKLCWQDCSAVARGAALVILTQENKLLYNYLALTLRRPARLAFWGHGRNFQSGAIDGWRERFKRAVSVHVDWWFAYTGLSQRLVEAMGFPVDRITNLENAVDTKAFADLCAKVTPTEIAECRARWNLGTGPVAVFVGSLYSEKRIDFLLAAAERLAADLPDFRLLVLGDGPLRPMVVSATTRHAWLSYAGPQFGAQKALCLCAANLMMNPGLVGLGILDSFVAGIPMVTTDCNMHSPEIDYLRNGINGVMTQDSLDAYVLACRELLVDTMQREKLVDAARIDATHFTVSNMAERFSAGILNALKVRPR